MDLESLTTITNFLRMPQEVIPRVNTRTEPLIDYNQNQILTLDGHVDTLHNNQQRKEELTQEKEAKKILRELITKRRAQERYELRARREQKIHERETFQLLSNCSIWKRAKDT